LRVNYTTGLSNRQLDELVARVEKRLPEPWDKGRGRKKKLSLRDAVAVTVAYLRHNSTEELLGEWWEVAQSNISDKITYLTPLVQEALEEFIPTEEDAVEMVKGRVCLLDGSISPCWSWAGHSELWTRKHNTTGNNFLLIANLSGDVLYASDPVPGSMHDKTATEETPVGAILEHSGGVIADKAWQGSRYVTPRKKPKGGELSAADKRENTNISRLRMPVERAVAHIKAWRILHTDYRRPLRTYRTSFRAALGLFFFRLAF
jgi:DDE superfamily endonuclease/Helix-turn-helix of DDE superfamily endonuclease